MSLQPNIGDWRAEYLYTVLFSSKNLVELPKEIFDLAPPDYKSKWQRTRFHLFLLQNIFMSVRIIGKLLWTNKFHNIYAAFIKRLRRDNVDKETTSTESVGEASGK